MALEGQMKFDIADACINSRKMELLEQHEIGSFRGVYRGVFNLQILPYNPIKHRFMNFSMGKRELLLIKIEEL